MSESTTIRYERDSDGIVTLTLDDPNQSANTMNEEFVKSLVATVDRLEAEKDDIKGVIIVSAKKTFFAGGDLNDLIKARKEDTADIIAGGKIIKGALRRLETLGKPVVSCVNGAALGGGLEICLSTHRIIVVNSPKIQLGLPEVSLGLLPGAGGVVRVTRMLGIVSGLMDVLLEGKRLRPEKALEIGLIEELVDSPDDLIPAAKKFIAENPEAVQPWDVKGYKMPGGPPSNPKLAMNLPAFPANLRKQLKGANYPAPHHIMAAAVEGAQVDFDTALDIEGRYFADLVTGQVAKNMTQAFFFDLQQVNGDRDRPADIARMAVGEGHRPRRRHDGRGHRVRLRKGRHRGRAQGHLAGERRARQGLLARISSTRPSRRGRMTQEKGDALLGPHPRRRPTPPDAAGRRPRHRGRVRGPDGQGAGLRRDRAVPQARRRPGLQHLDPADHRPGRGRVAPRRLHRPALLLPRGQDAAAGDHQGREDAATRSSTARCDFGKQIKKTPIVVNDSRGFFTSRVIGTFINEGIAMLDRGHPGAVDRAGRARRPATRPRSLQLCDELNLGLMAKIRKAIQGGHRGRGRHVGGTHPSFASSTGCSKLERAGKLAGAGFYDYEDGKRTGLWTGLKEECGRREPRRPVRGHAGAHALRRGHRDGASASTRASSSRSPTPTSARSSASASRPGPVACCSTSTATRTRTTPSSSARPRSWPARVSSPRRYGDAVRPAGVAGGEGRGRRGLQRRRRGGPGVVAERHVM